MGKFTVKQIETWIKNNERFEGRSDGKGLYLCYRKTFSTPQWRFRYKLKGKSQQLFIGQFPSLTLAQARTEAKKLKARVILGFNPAAEKRKQKAESIAEIEAHKNRITVSKLADEYYLNKVNGSIKNPKAALGHITRVKKVLGKMTVEEVNTSHITNMYEMDLKRGYPSSTNKMREQTKKMFKYGVVKGVIQSSPAILQDISYAGGGQPSRSRTLSKEELTELFAQMNLTKGFGRENYLTIKLLLLLCVRKSELIKAKKIEFDLDDGVWLLEKKLSINKGRNNKGGTICIPLPKQAIDTLKELFTLSSSRAFNSEYILPARRETVGMLPHISENTLNVAMEKIKNIPHFVIHDLRRTAKTKMQELGIDEFISERCLNHKLAGVQGTYGRHDFLDERKEALQNWADYLSACEVESIKTKDFPKH